MVPKDTTGRSFKGAAAYLLHDKRASTSERVAWTHTENLRNERGEWAWREMAWTALQADALKRETGQSTAGRKAEKPVYHLSLSWAKDEAPTKEEMIAAGKDALKAIGLENHQTLFVCHNDEPQPHIHLLVNRVNAENGKLHTLSRSHRKLSAWALKYEYAQGEIRCKKRVDNNRSLQQGNNPRHKTQSVIADAWARSDSGKAFKQALAEKGYVLARGNTRIVVVDPHGKVINPARHLYGVKAADVNARVSEIAQELPDVEKVPARIENKGNKDGRKKKETNAEKSAKRPEGKQDERNETYDRDAAEAAQQNALLDAADDAAARSAQIEREKALEAKRQAEKVRTQTNARIRILNEGKKRRQALKAQQRAERERLERGLREKDSPSEAAHRARWQGMIDAEKMRIDELTGNLEQKGIAGAAFRFLHGKDAREEIQAREKNIENETMRLAEGVGGLGRSDVQRLKDLRLRHSAQRKALEEEIDEQLLRAEGKTVSTDTGPGRATRKKKPAYHTERFSRSAAPEQDNRAGRKSDSRADIDELDQGLGIGRDHE